MEDLNARMEKPLPIIRFRPNIIFRGGNPFDEDHWAEISIGDAGKFWLLSRSPRYIYSLFISYDQMSTSQC